MDNTTQGALRDPGLCCETVSWLNFYYFVAKHFNMPRLTARVTCLG